MRLKDVLVVCGFALLGTVVIVLIAWGTVHGVGYRQTIQEERGIRVEHMRTEDLKDLVRELVEELR